MKLAGARIVITGASRGLGEHLARSLAKRGAQVVLVARSGAAIAELARELGGESFACDLADCAAIEPLAGAILADGPVDALINNAGVDLTGSLTDLAAEAIAQLFVINLTAPVLLSRALLPAMLQQGHGTILNVSSLAGTNAMPGAASYSASKAGLSHFTASLGAELRGRPITLTLAEIGPIESDMMTSLRAHRPMRKALERLESLKLVKDIPMSVVVNALVRALERDKAHVRLPRRDAMFPLLVGLPRSMSRLLLTGVDVRPPATAADHVASSPSPNSPSHPSD